MVRSKRSQAVELLLGATNFVLMSLNLRDGLRLAGGCDKRRREAMPARKRQPIRESAGAALRVAFTVSDVQCVSQRPPRAFLDGFAQRWMGMDGDGGIFEACAHLERVREGRAEFGNVAA